MGVTLRFTIPGAPVPKARARTFTIAKGPRAGKVRTVTPAKTRAYERKVAVIARLQANVQRWRPAESSRFSVTITVWREANRGDIDNVVKGIFDGMNEVVWSDDAKVIELHAVMRIDRANPRVEVEVTEIREEAA